jgi:hypothetical protein
VEQCFSFTAKQPQPAYKPQKQPAEQGDRVRERIEYRFRVPSAAVFTLYSHSKALEYRFRVPTAGRLMTCLRFRQPLHSMPLFFETRLQTRSRTRTYPHLYEHTHAHSIPVSTSEKLSWIGKFSD